MDKKQRTCFICTRSEHEVEFMVQGAKGAICADCIQEAYKMYYEEYKGAKAEAVDIDDFKVLKPKEMKKFLDQYVIGQDEAKKVLSVAVYNHYKRLKHNTLLPLVKEEKEDDVEIEKANILLIGETGTGKTLLAKTIARMLNLPFTIADSTEVIPAGGLISIT